MSDVRIPMRAVGDGADLIDPTVGLLHGLSLLPTEEQYKEATGSTGAFRSIPDSVAVIEAGATAASKWWSVAIAGGATLLTARISTLWHSIGDDGPWNQPFALLAMALIAAVAFASIAYLLGSDVRGRAAGAVATIRARQEIAVEMTRQAGEAHARSVLPLQAFPVQRSGRHWLVVAAREGVDSHGQWEMQFLVVRDGEADWVEAREITGVLMS